MNRLNKTESAVFKYSWLSLFVKDRLFQDIEMEGAKPLTHLNIGLTCILISVRTHQSLDLEYAKMPILYLCFRKSVDQRQLYRPLLNLNILK